jgi:hypothetical protein
MRFLQVRKDGGPKSGVTGFFVIEIKSLFSVVLLKFERDYREEFHSHAFNALTWWIYGSVIELHKDGRALGWRPSILPKWTPRSCFHKIIPMKTAYAFSIRGPWSNKWYEYNPISKETTTLTNGREIVERTEACNKRSLV